MGRRFKSFHPDQEFCEVCGMRFPLDLFWVTIIPLMKVFMKCELIMGLDIVFITDGMEHNSVAVASR